MARKIYTIIEKNLLLYKKLSKLLFQLYKTQPLEVGNQKHPLPFSFMRHCTVGARKLTTRKNYIKTKCMIRKFQPIMNMKEIKSLTKNLELQINQ